MIEKQHVEAFLKANGVKETASDEEIRSVLISARWDHEEIDTALIVLKENMTSHETHIDTLHKVFNSDSRLNAAEITALLGIEVSLTHHDVTTSVSEKRQLIERGRIIFSFILSVFLATASVGYVFYRTHGPVVNKVTHAVPSKSLPSASSTKVIQK
jgi:hypothetical protein